MRILWINLKCWWCLHKGSHVCVGYLLLWRIKFLNIWTLRLMLYAVIPVVTFDGAHQKAGWPSWKLLCQGLCTGVSYMPVILSHVFCFQLFFNQYNLFLKSTSFLIYFFLDVDLSEYSSFLTSFFDEVLLYYMWIYTYQTLDANKMFCQFFMFLK